MSDLVGNHIVGFPTRRLKYNQMRCKDILIKLSGIMNCDIFVVLCLHTHSYASLLLCFVVLIEPIFNQDIIFRLDKKCMYMCT